MDLHRINVKFFLEDPRSLTPEDTFRIFNAWISRRVEEGLVDVADYSHVPAGPITVLVGHEANYSIDNTDGKKGLLYARKQPLQGDLSDRFRRAFAAALQACRRLEEDPALQGRVKFRGNEVLLVANDRGRAPNTAETVDAIKPHLDATLETLYGEAGYTAAAIEDPKQRLTLHIKSTTSPDLSTLQRHLDL